jgi:hypothetical protein
MKDEGVVNWRWLWGWGIIDEELMLLGRTGVDASSGGWAVAGNSLAGRAASALCCRAEDLACSGVTLSLVRGWCLLRVDMLVPSGIVRPSIMLDYGWNWYPIGAGGRRV